MIEPSTIPDPDLTSAFRALIQRRNPGLLDADVKGFDFDFDGALLPLSAGQRCAIRVPWPCRIVGCYAYAALYTTTTFSIRLGTSIDWPANTPIDQATGIFSMANIDLAAFLAFDVTTWIQELQRDDVLDVSLVAPDTTNTHLLVALDVRRVSTSGRSFGTLLVGDDTSNQVVDDDGNPVTERE